MKKIYLPIIAIIVTNFSFSQTKETKEADNFFDKFEYVNAANSYLKLTQNEKSSPYVYKQLADCYYNVFNTKEAIKWYAKATETTQNAETYYRYAQMLKAEGQLEESNKQMNQFASMKPNDTRAKEFLNVLTKTEKKTSTKKLFEVEKSKINSENTDFGAFLTNDNQLYFVSSRNTGKKKSSMNEEQYLDIYKSTKNTDGTITDINPVSELNSKWHDGPLSITSDGNIMYYASESFNENKFQKNKEKHLKYSQIYLYKSIKILKGNGQQELLYL